MDLRPPPKSMAESVSPGLITFNSTGIHYDNHSEVQLDDFRYYSKGLSTEEVAALYNNGAGTEEENPVLEQAASEMPTGNAPNPGQYVMNVDYTPAGQIKKVEYGSGSVTAYTYDPLTLRLSRMVTVDQSSTMIQDLNYTYDSVGNILSITDAVNTDSQTFQYDALNRLTQAVGASYGTKNYSYDEIGNITEKDGLTYTYGEGNAGPHAVTSLSDGTTFTYDANGNMATMQKGAVLTQYLYDSENRLIEVLEGGTLKAEFEYDGDGGRTKKTTYGASTVVTKFIGSLYEERNTVSTQHIFLGDTRIASITGGETVYFHANHLGSSNLITDAGGVLKELIEYQPYGSFSRHEKYGPPSSEIAWHYFTGQRFDDEIGLYFYNARYYNPVLGRFLTPDTFVQNPGGDPQTFNRYSYVGNNPINRTDSSGHFWKSFLKSFVRALITVIITAVAGPIIGAALGAAATTAIFGGNTNEIWTDAGFAAANSTGLGRIIVGGTQDGIRGVGLSILGSSFIGGLAYTASTGNRRDVGKYVGSSIGNVAGNYAGSKIVATLEDPAEVEAEEEQSAQDQTTTNDQTIRDTNAQKASPLAVVKGAKAIVDKAGKTGNVLSDIAATPTNTGELESVPFLDSPALMVVGGTTIKGGKAAFNAFKALAKNPKVIRGAAKSFFNQTKRLFRVGGPAPNVTELSPESQKLKAIADLLGHIAENTKNFMK